MEQLRHRLAALHLLLQPLAVIFLGVVLLSVGVAVLLFYSYQGVALPPVLFYLSLQFLPELLRGWVLIVLGAAVLLLGIWLLSSVAVIRLSDEIRGGAPVALGYRRTSPPRIAVLSGGAGVLVLSHLSEHTRSMTCITPLHEPIEYYYRASGPFQGSNVHYVVPTPDTPAVYAQLNNGNTANVMHVDHTAAYANLHVTRLFLQPAGSNGNGSDAPDRMQRGNGQGAPGDTLTATDPATLPLTRPARDAVLNADVLLLGPGSLFESILPNFLLNEMGEVVRQSKARKIYICNLMTEPGLTTGFSVGDHIRAIRRYAGFAPDYVLVNVQRIESGLQQLYASAQQTPVYLSPEELEETVVPSREGLARTQLVLEGSVIVEADLASSVVQYNASLANPGQSWTVRVLRHDPEKLTSAILALLQSG